MIGIKLSVKIRKKILKNGDLSLYLDIYHNGKRYYEFLDLRIYSKPKKSEKDLNKENLNLAYQIKVQRESDLNHQKHNILNPKNNKIILLNEFQNYIDKIKGINTQKTYQYTYNHLVTFIGAKQITLNNANELFFKEFIEYLESKGITNNSINLYFSKLNAFYAKLINDKITFDNPISNIKIKTKQSHKAYFIKDDIEVLYKNFDESKEYQRAFLFSCFTGLRFGDVFNLKYSNIESNNKGDIKSYQISITMGKSEKEILRIPINESAQKLIDVNCKDDRRIFKLSNIDIKPDDKIKINENNSQTNKKLANWFKRCGLMKKGLSFHSGRHSFTVMLLMKDVSIYDISKLLGHKDIKTTQIYCNSLFSKQLDNVNSINL